MRVRQTTKKGGKQQDNAQWEKYKGLFGSYGKIPCLAVRCKRSVGYVTGGNMAEKIHKNKSHNLM
jgi:hypothetical protein